MVYDGSGAKVMEMVRPRKILKSTLQILDASGAEVGRITKQWAGILREGFSTADHYMFQVTGRSALARPAVPHGGRGGFGGLDLLD